MSGQYPSDWNEIATQVKAAAGWRCVRCGHPHDTPNNPADCDDGCDQEKHGPGPRKQRVLTVHHLDGDKSNCRWWNLAALCQVCHLKIQAKVVMDRPWTPEHSEWFKPYAAGYYAWKYEGEEIDRDEADVRLSELLAYEHRRWLLI